MAKWQVARKVIFCDELSCYIMALYLEEDVSCLSEHTVCDMKNLCFLLKSNKELELAYIEIASLDPIWS